MQKALIANASGKKKSNPPFVISHACVQKEAMADFVRFVRKIITKREFVATVVPIVRISVSTS